MINKVNIFDLSTATKYSYKENYHGFNAWISAVDEEDRFRISRIRKNFLKNKNFKFFVQYFYDWSDEDLDAYISKNIEQMGPQKYHIQNIISFVRDNLINSNTVYNLGINCYAGISRSTAIGITTLVLNGKTPSEALLEILKVRPQAWPNLRILKFASEILNIDIYEDVKNWKAKNKNTLYVGI
jgi:hypothetical protein